MTAAPAINKYLRPACEPLMNSGRADRLFLHPGRWHRFGRNMRTRCEILVEATTDSLPPLTAKILLWICRGMGGAGLAIGAMILASVSVQLWLEPLLALNFNRMSWISPLANLILVPFSSIVLAVGMAASVATGLPHFGPAFLWLAGSSASLLLNVASHITALSGAWQRCPTPSSVWVLAGILILSIWSFFEWRRFWIPCLYIAALLGCVSCGSVPVAGALFQNRQEKASVLSFTFLDVGEGDSIVIRFPDRRVWVLDAGGLRLAPSHEENAYAFDIGEAVVSRYLWHAWITTLDRVILSHIDQDHAGGMPAVMKNFRVSGFDYSGSGPDAILSRILGIAREKNISPRQLHAGMEERVGQVRVRTLNPPADVKSATPNDNSIVLQFSFKNFSALLTGDLEKSGEYSVLTLSENLRSQLLKVAHHGSRTATSNAFLHRTQPRWAIVSAGRNNPFNHPAREVLARLRHHGARTFLTTDDGAVTLETDGSCYTIKSHVRGILERGSLKGKNATNYTNCTN
jgi:competence protein ComEC